MSMEVYGYNKRGRDESAEFPEAKRLREADLISDILDNDDALDSGSDGVEDLADVIKSLEEEIMAPAPALEEEDNRTPLLVLGYLLEASDDELGLPPAVGSSPPSSSSDGVEVVEIADDETEEVAGFDRIWGFEDDVSAASPYEGLEFGVQTEFDDGVIFNGGLFDYWDLFDGPSDANEFSWRMES